MLYGIINRLFHFNTLTNSIATMENLMFGATLNPDGSLRKIHIVSHGKKIICKKNHFIKNFLLQRFIRLIRFRKQLSFVADVQTNQNA